MKLDKKTLDMISSLPDEKLWQIINVIAVQTGMTVNSKMPDKEKMSQIRSAMSNLTDGDLSRAAEIFDLLKGGNKNG